MADILWVWMERIEMIIGIAVKFAVWMGLFIAVASLSVGLR